MIPVPEAVRNELAIHFGLPAAGLSHLGGGREDSDGIAYACHTPQGEVVLKIMAFPANDPDGLARFEERLRFVHFLGQRGVEIVYPLPGPDGSLQTTCPAGENLFIAYLMRRRQGHHPQPQDWGAGLPRAWGLALGRLHRATQEYPTWRGTELTGSSGQPLLGWEQEWQGFSQNCQDPEVKEQWGSIRARLEQLPTRRDCFGFIHNDPHNQNILFDGEQLVLLDFDVANYHWFATDISITLQGLLFEKSGGLERPCADPAPIRAFLDAFLAGYELENHLDAFWLSQLDLFVSYRRILLFIVMQGWLETKPEVRSSWKDMILNEPLLLA